MNDTRLIRVVDDDPELRRSLGWMLGGAGLAAELYTSAEQFLERDDLHRSGCVLVDVRMPHMDGLELQRRIRRRGSQLPVVVMSGHADVPTAVHAMEEGALSFLEKPFTKDELLGVLGRALQRADELVQREAAHRADLARIADLTPRELEVMRLVVGGELTKRIAQQLGISERTVDKHRERILAKTGAESWAGLTLLAARLELVSGQPVEALATA
ncbi:MAG: Response regulator protein TodT [Phycisphaerae bacterium]|nr:Response regulator protein TodT [Phycisphaerae bacterium]